MCETWQSPAVPKARKEDATAQIILVALSVGVACIIVVTILHGRLYEERFVLLGFPGFVLLSLIDAVWSSVRTLSIRIDENGVSKLGPFGDRQSIAWSDVTSVSTRSRMAKLWFGEKVCICSHAVRICLREEEIKPVDKLLRFIEQHVPADRLAGVQRIERQDERAAIGS